MDRSKRTIWIALLALIASAIVAVLTAVPASATGACHDPNIGGDFYCNGDFHSGEAWQEFPNGHFQVFVVGSDHNNKQLWTRWQTANGGWSKWTSLGGHCPCGYAPGLLKSGELTWHPTVIMIGDDYRGWYRTRRGNSGWSAWSCCHNSASNVTRGHRPAFLGG